MSAFVLIGLACWLAIVIVVLAALRAASHADDLADRQARAVATGVPADAPLPHAELPGSARRRRLAVAEAATVVLVAVLAADQSQAADWEPLALTGMLAVLAIAGDLQAFRARRFRISASFPALVVAMVVLGPAPAVAIGAACALADAVLTRPRLDQLTSNLLAYTAPTLVGALVVEASGIRSGDLAHLEPVLVVIGVYVLTTALNFLLIAGHTALLARGGLRAMVRAEFVPVLPWEACAAAVTAAAVYVYGVRGEAGVAVLAIVGIAFQWLLSAVVEGLRRGTVIERQTEELGVHTEGMVGLVLHLLELRDPAFARHAATVAHHARALAAAAGMTEREQDIAHTAGLLHDIGRQAFDDGLLAGHSEVGAAGRRAIHRHPLVGAQLLRQVPGMWEVADAIETHHERVDGTGYPHGLSDGSIPRVARMIAVAEVYDVLTAEDSYRGSRDHEWAAQELRRVAGTQLDARLVELFLTAVPHKARRPSLEEELPALRRSLGVLGPRPAAG
jgi:putative nucleotidyltransferase with HDIG domain